MTYDRPYIRTGAPVAVQWCVVIAIAPLLILAAVVDVVEALWDHTSDQPGESL